MALTPLPAPDGISPPRTAYSAGGRGSKFGYQDAEIIRENTDETETRLAALEAGGTANAVTSAATIPDNMIVRGDGGSRGVQNGGISIADGASGTLSGTNSGDVTLVTSIADYISRVGQALTLQLINLAAHVTGRLPYANLTAATAAARILVRGSGSGGGDWQEGTLGPGLSLTGTQLSASAAAPAMDDITDVAIASPTQGQYLRYNAAVPQWENATLPLPTSGSGEATYMVSGGQAAYSGTGLTWNVSAASYVIQGEPYTSAADSVTLATAHATLDRIDVIALDVNGDVVVITGTASTPASEPTVDPTTQIRVTAIPVAAASTTSDVADEPLYLENAGGPGEWNWTTSGSGFNVASTNNPRTGTTVIEGTTVSNNAYAQGAIPSGTLDPNEHDRLVIYIRSKAGWASVRVLRVQWFSSGVARGTAVTIASGYWGFDSSNTTQYQLVSIPMVQFAISTGLTVNQIRITDSGGSIGFYIDDISLQSGGGTETTSIIGITQEQADARYAPLSKYGSTGLIDGQFGNDAEHALGNVGATETIDWDNGNQQWGTLDQNCVFTLSDHRAASRYALILVMGGSGGHSATFSGVKWPEGSAPDLSALVVGDVALFTFMRTGAAGGTYLGFYSYPLQ